MLLFSQITRLSAAILHAYTFVHYLIAYIIVITTLSRIRSLGLDKLFLIFHRLLLTLSLPWTPNGVNNIPVVSSLSTASQRLWSVANLFVHALISTLICSSWTIITHGVNNDHRKHIYTRCRYGEILIQLTGASHCCLAEDAQLFKGYTECFLLAWHLLVLL